MRAHALAVLTAGLTLATATAATADVFNGRIAFSSFRGEPAPGAPRTGDIFTMNPDGTDQRQLTTNPADDAQADWAPDGQDIAYRIRKPNSAVNFEVARMTASGADQVQVTDTVLGQASSQPTWFPDKSAILFRRSGPGLVASIWRMGALGEDPRPAFDPDGPQWYPSLSPDMTKVLFATTMSAIGDTDRGIFTLNADGTDLTPLFDVAGAFDSGPAWSPDGARVAFESNADPAGGNPEGDMEIWVMNADGTDPVQLTSNADHDEGAAWSPDGTLIAYSSGPDNGHVHINVMTVAGEHRAQLTDPATRDESPDWQPIPAPETDHRCGDLADSGPGAHDVRTSGTSCRKALRLAARWLDAGQPASLRRFDAEVTDYGGTLRVVLTQRHRHLNGRGHDGRRRSPRLVAFLYQPPPA